MTQLSPLTYTKPELQAALHTPSHAGFLKRLAILEADGFPKRLPFQNGQRALWSKLAVDAWLANWGSPNHPPETVTPPTAEAMQTLRNHYEAPYVSN